MTLKRTIGYFITNLSKQTERQETIAVSAPAVRHAMQEWHIESLAV